MLASTLFYDLYDPRELVPSSLAALRSILASGLTPDEMRMSYHLGTLAGHLACEYESRCESLFGHRSHRFPRQASRPYAPRRRPRHHGARTQEAEPWS